MAQGTGTITDPRIYDISTETAQGVAYLARLIREIVGSSITSVIADVGSEEGSVSQGAVTGGSLAVSFQTTPSGAELTTLDALVLAHDGTAPATPGWKKWEDNGTSSTQSGTFQTLLERTSPDLGGGVWRISVICQARIVAATALDSEGTVRFSVDGQIKALFPVTTEEWHTFSGWDFSTFNDGDRPVLTIDARRVGGDDTLEVRRMKFSVEKME